MHSWIKNIAVAALILKAPSLLQAQETSLEALAFPKEALEARAKEHRLDMCWSFGKYSHFRFVTTYDNVYLEARLDHLPSEYDAFIAKMQDKLVAAEPGVWTFSYNLDSDGCEQVNTQQVPRHFSPDSTGYILTERRIFQEAKPASLTPSEVAQLLSSKSKVLFYTGAGLSIAAGVPSMEELVSLLEFGSNEQIIYSLETVFTNPQKTADVAAGFSTACLLHEPTEAHRAIKSLSEVQNTRVITENLDSLHERSGMNPYRLLDADEARALLSPEVLAQFDYVICAGLSFDDRGFLGWYKEHHPKGKLIAIDLKQPSYLGDEDFLVTGDVQEVLPFISDLVAVTPLKGE